MEYNPGSFTDVFNTEMGPRLWTYLNEQDAITQMNTATYLGKPAAQALSPGLLATFDEKTVRSKRVKMCIGHMIKQIVVARGYEIDRKNVVITDPDNLFTVATRYRQFRPAGSAMGEAPVSTD
jgi:hypothetical protein